MVEASLRGADLWDEVKDQPEAGRPEPVAGPAAAAVHRPGDRRQARGDPDGRAVLGARPHRHAEGRGADARACRASYTIVIVTHNMQQAARASDITAMMMLTEDRKSGTIIEVGETKHMFTQPKDSRTEGYVTGRYG